MASKITIFDHHAHYLTEISAATTPRSWVINDFGRCEFSISTSDAKCKEQYLQYGNLVHIEHIPTQDASGNTNGKLPAWVGVILPPRNWDFGVIHINAYGAEGFLSFRAMPHKPIKGTPREIFTTILDEARRAASNIVVQPGFMDDMPQILSDDLRLSAYDHIKTLIKNSGMSWDITGKVDERGNLNLYGNLYRRKGSDTSLILSNTNTELSTPLLSEQGTPFNQVFGYSQAQTAKTRHYGEGKNQEALDDYGPLQTNTVFMGMHDSASVTTAAQVLADNRGRPRKIIQKRVVLDKGLAFSSLETGNTVTIKDTNAGFAAGGGFGLEVSARILSLDYNDLSNSVPVNLEVI